MEIGLIGSGLIGKGIGLNLLKAGYNVTVLEHKSRENINYLLNNGAFVTNNLEELAKKCKKIILCLPSSDEVELVLLKENGLIDLLGEDSLIIDCTTANPNSTNKIQKISKDRKIHYLDAPVIRGPQEALAGKLITVVGGDREQYKINKKIIDCFSEKVIYVGESGSANKLKLINNFISMTFTFAIMVGLKEAKRNKIEFETLDSLMKMGSNYIPALPNMIKWIESNDDSILQFSIKNAAKDLKYFNSIASNEGKYKSFLDEIVTIFDELSKEDDQVLYLPSIFKLIDEEK